MSPASRETTLRDAIRSVVDSGNCSGCGACALLDPAIEIAVDKSGFMRPSWAPEGQHPDVQAPDAQDTGTVDARAAFERICPGVAVRAPGGARPVHPAMGPHLETYVGWATDEQVRWSGSSGGVLTALAAWLLDTGRISASTATGRAAGSSTGTQVDVVRSGQQVRERAGSRYAPASVLAALDLEQTPMVIGKPCEIDAMRRLSAVRGDAEPPLLLSFFCAGTPSQTATDRLVERLGADAGSVVELRYRGNGWPGEFRVRDAAGHGGDLSYHESWGQHLGRDLQQRCKICPDGTGEHADLAVGDFWTSDEGGYPVFTDQAGRSAIIVRTARGQQVLADAVAAGVIEVEPVAIDDVAAVQPSQVLRRHTLLGRLLGRRLAGVRIPRISGYPLVRTALRHPRRNLDFARGTFRRARSR